MELIQKEINENAIDGMLLLGTEMEEQDFKPFLSLDIPVLLLDSFY